jgi:hypothetical protein
MSETIKIKLPGLTAPIVIDQAAVAAHILRPQSADVSADSFQQQVNAQRSAQVQRAAQLRLARPARLRPRVPLTLDVQGFRRHSKRCREALTAL